MWTLSGLLATGASPGWSNQQQLNHSGIPDGAEARIRNRCPTNPVVEDTAGFA